MADLRVLRTEKASDGDILALCGDWTPYPKVQKNTAIQWIESGAHRFYVQYVGRIVWVNVVNGLTGKYLRTDADNTTRNNLLDLPDC